MGVVAVVPPRFKVKWGWAEASSPPLERRGEEVDRVKVPPNVKEGAAAAAVLKLGELTLIITWVVEGKGGALGVTGW